MSKTIKTLPKTQHAVRLVGPGRLELDSSKEVPVPGPHQILARVEAVGLCFSDLKLLKQFDRHVRKGRIVEGLSPEVLRQIPSYVPGRKPTVPGHECVCEIVAAGDGVARHRVGERCLVQTDYRALRTARSNAAFGYNFEGALQEYVLMDERVIIDPTTDERYLIPVSQELSASAVALVEPWACVEDSYVTDERREIKAGGKLLVVVDEGREPTGLAEGLSEKGKPGSLTSIGPKPEANDLRGLEVRAVRDVSALGDEEFDDIVYFGADAATVEALNPRLAGRGILNIVTAGRTFDRPVSLDVGRIHYGMTRFTGTTGARAGDGYDRIPPNGQIRPNDKVVVIGAGGPMGQMHVLRDLCTGLPGVSVTATDLDQPRLEALAEKAGPLAEANGVGFRVVNTKTEPLDGKFSYFALMVPVADLVAQAVAAGDTGCRINVFAGIPAGTRAEIDLDAYLAKRCWMFGTSGSVIKDMKIVLDKVSGGQLDTNRSVEAVSGMAGAIDGVAAVEDRTLAGKIIVYPALRELALTPVAELRGRFPTVADRLDGSMWTKAAEDELLRVAR